MIALDTNVLVRYLAQDDARQSLIAARLVETTLSPTNRGFVSLVALLETVSVMESAYGADTASIEVQDAASVRDAIVRFRKGDVDLHGCLIQSLAAQRGAKTVTFDAKASKRFGMALLK